MVHGPLVCGPSLDISDIINYIFCLKLGHHKDTKVTEPDFLKNLGGHKWEAPHFGGIFMFLSLIGK